MKIETKYNVGDTVFYIKMNRIKGGMTMKENKLKPNEYMCSCCGGTFEKGWTDEEAFQEKEIFFPHVDNDDCCIVCNDCYKDIQPH